MTTHTPDISTLATYATTFRTLHGGPKLLALPNAWDAASARVFEQAGFPAIATTSGAVAATLGWGDHEQAPADEMLDAAARIARAVAIPVSGDVEGGYGMSPADLARRVVAAGLVGVNLEDTDHRAPQGAPLLDADKHAEWLAAFKTEARALGVDVVVNARVDVFLQRDTPPDEQMTEAIRRGRIYRDAGADCLYPIFLSEGPAIETFVQGVGGAVNIFYRSATPSFAELEAIGVRRVTFATSMFRELMKSLEKTATELRATTGGTPTA